MNTNTITKGDNNLMNASSLLPILTFLVGGFLGMAIGARLFRKEFERRTQSLREDNEQLSRSNVELRSKNRELMDGKEVGLDKTDTKVETALVEDGLTPRKEGDRGDLKYVGLTNRFLKSPMSSRPADVSREHPTDDPPLTGPHAISEDTFFKEYTTYRESTCTFYQKSAVLVGEDGEKMGKADYYVGDKLHHALLGTNEDVIYVENDELQTRYEIIIDHDNDWIDKNEEGGEVDYDEEEVDEEDNPELGGFDRDE